MATTIDEHASHYRYAPLVGFKQSGHTTIKPISGTTLGELVTGSGTKSCAITYNTDGLMATMVITKTYDGSDLTRTVTFSYNADEQLTGFTVA